MKNGYFKIIVGIMILALWAVPTYWLFYPYEPLVIDHIKIVNPDGKVKAGSLLIYEITYEKKMNIVGTLTRKIENTFVFDLRPSIATAPVGKGKDRVMIPIPTFADPASDYQLRWTVCYQVNPIRKVVVTAMSDRFEVIR